MIDLWVFSVLYNSRESYHRASAVSINCFIDFMYPRKKSWKLIIIIISHNHSSQNSPLDVFRESEVHCTADPSAALTP